MSLWLAEESCGINVYGMSVGKRGIVKKLPPRCIGGHRPSSFEERKYLWALVLEMEKSLRPKRTKIDLLWL